MTIFGKTVVAVVEMELDIVDVAVVVDDGVEDERMTIQCYSSLARYLGLQVGKEHNTQNYVEPDWMIGGRGLEG